jgi:hypothetical protein
MKEKSTSSTFALENNPIDGINQNTIDSEQVIDYTEIVGNEESPIVGSSTQ